MGMLVETSLGATVDAVADAYFFGRKTDRAEREAVAGWIAGRQGAERSYSGLFAPTKLDFEKGFRVFTGERINSGAGTSHIIGEEAMRAMMLLGARGKQIAASIENARRGFETCLSQNNSAKYAAGMFCCGICSVAYWRNLLSGGLDDGERRLSLGLKALKAHRDGEGKWKRFPFHFTILAAAEAADGAFGTAIAKAARAEIKYAAPGIERVVKRAPNASDMYAVRRHSAMERALKAI